MRVGARRARVALAAMVVTAVAVAVPGTAGGQAASGGADSPPHDASAISSAT